MVTKLFQLFDAIRNCLAPPPPTPPGGTTHDEQEKLLLEYSLSRYKEIDELIGRARQAGQSLLTWQTAFLLGCLGIEAKAGLLGYEPQTFLVQTLSILSAFVLAFAVVLSARVAFWTEPAESPTSPRVLFDALCGAGIDKRELCRMLVGVYEYSKRFVARLQKRLRQSLWLEAAGLLLFVFLFVLLSLGHKPVFERLFDIKTPTPVVTPTR